MPAEIAMRRPVLAVTTAILFALPLVTLAQPGSGRQWEIKMQIPGMTPEMAAEMEEARKAMEGMEMPEGMQMPGMPQMQGGMMVQNACLPKDNNEPPPANEDCTLLEQRSTGNRHHVKMRCPDGTIEVDQTRTDTTMTTHMKMTENNGAVSEMDMTGRLLGECDYTAEVDAQRRQVAAVKKQVDDAQRKSKEQIAALCKESLEKMQGHIIAREDLCSAADRKEFCRRVQTTDGYRLFLGTRGNAPDAPGYRLDDPLKHCGTTEAKLRALLCDQAVAAKDLKFVDEFCPDQRPRLCAVAEQREELWYIARHCAEARAGLVAEHCAGRKFSAQIDPKYRDFCAGALGRDLKGGTTPGVGAAGGEQPEEPAQPADPVQQGVKKGVEGLKKVFGF
jgi:hypothetical protein